MFTMLNKYGKTVNMIEKLMLYCTSKLYLILKFLHSILLFLLFSLSGFCQNFSVLGMVVDANDNPIEFANVLLLNEDINDILKGTSTDDKGFFSLNDLEPNTYTVKVSYIGFADYEQKIILTGNLDLKTIQLIEADENLDEVNIFVKKPTLIREADRLIFNIENTALVEGNMLQVLKSTPSVLVVGDEIKVKNSNPTVYINNRKVHLSSGDLNQLLEGSSANSIKSVEVITNPSARYDAQSGVVLNIVMSKNLVTGYRGSVYTNFRQGVFPRSNVGTGHFFKNDNISFNVNYNYGNNKINREGDDTVNYLDSSNEVDEIWRSLTDRNTWSETHNLNANFDYFIDKNNTLSLSSNALYIPYFKYKISNNTSITDANDLFLSSFTSNNLSRDTKYNFGFDLDYNHSFTEGQLAINTHFTTYNYERNQDVISRFFDMDNNFENSNAFSTNANQDTQIFAAKADYSLPIEDNSSFETGVKFSNVITESDINQFDVDVDTGDETIDELNSDAFDYDERIFAGYINYAYGDDTFNFNLGLRAEQTNIDGQSPLTDISTTQDYLELFPNASFQYNISETYNVYANYKRSLTRPNYIALNPFRFFFNDNYVIAGNPDLVPTFQNHYNIGISLFDGLLIVEAYYDNYDGAISQIPRQNNDTNVIEFTFVNFDKTVEFGFDFLIDYYPTEKWNMSFVTSFYNIEEETDFGDGFVKKDQWSNYSELYNSYSFLEDNSLNASLSLIWLGKNLQGFNIVENRLFSELSISKTLLNKKGILTLSISDLFNMQDQDSSVRYQNQFSSTFTDLDNRYVKLGFRYKFGNTKLETNERVSDLEERERLNKKGN